ncbi:adenylate/guanylate cyclase domain-containing protein [Altibacter sp.]|uniref:adenylate/guanylate cyclase domain-containing protein n=1 Tax=Altibacter sp. TaxID=2024823 RepID=UPI00258522C1|nr:adenylate/guanylate cyclase domain-containing protein [Altibacter sp.]MCW9038174.1 adenylate/guanylate cyclase domain-containing protein [Altibacter sp.]
MIHPKYGHYFRQIIVFAIIWLIFGMLYALLEVGLLGNTTSYPTTGIDYYFGNNILYFSLGSLLMGVAQGSIEVFWLHKQFVNKPLWVKIFWKSLIYLFLILLFLLVLTIVTSWVNAPSGTLDASATARIQEFMGQFSFWSIVIYAGVALNIALIFSDIQEYIGRRLLYNFLLGRYHHPNQECRIFMFLDMKSSTTIAENMGHAQYFQLIKTYYANMTDAILETSGEIYQYVGDEIVISWPEKKGLYKNNCINCFCKIEKDLFKNRHKYLEEFGIVPSFKAGFHIGEVTTGEIGIIKKDIIYTGDVLNTTARIQAQCNTYDAKALISEALMRKLPPNTSFSFTKLGELKLRGKSEDVLLYRIDL